MSSYDVVGDWGTTHLRLFRVEQGQAVAQLKGPGIAAAGRQAEAAFAETVAPWLADGMPGEIRLCGMVGARDGWVEAPYAECPADDAAWRKSAVCLDWRGTPLQIMAGLACTSLDSVPDVLRGEETQIFGALALHPELATGRRLLVLPGTHSKWTLVEDGRVLRFRTIPTGELFALLRDRSTMGAQVESLDAAQEDAGFAEGMDRAGEGRPLSSLFAARAMRLRAGRSPDWSLGYLSGILIGSEIAEACTLFGHSGEVILIGDARLCKRYERALAAQSFAPRTLEGDACALAGLGVRS